MLRLHRHRQGPRIYLAGLRIHEWHVGGAVLAGVLTGFAAGAWRLTPIALLVLAGGAWLVLKDWRDILPSKRDTAAWRLGLHRPVAPLRAIRRAEGLPSLAGAVAFAVGLVNLLSTLTPNVAWRHHLLLQLEPVEAVPLFHTLAVPASCALIAVSFHLRARRRRAWQVAVALLLALGVLAIFRGLEFEEALISWGAAGLLWWGRDSFYVRHERLHPRSALVVTLGAVGGGCALAGIGIWVATRAEPSDVVRELGNLLTWTKGPMAFGGELSWVPLSVGALGLVAIVALTAVLFRPLGSPRALPGAEARVNAAELVHRHGHDTLAFFKLRSDAHYHFAQDGQAFVGYRVANRVLIISGDPVGASGSLPGLIGETCAFAEERGLRVAALGVSEALLPVYRDAGLRSVYLGDEAIVETRRFSLEGRAVRKIRQSVSRLQNAGYAAEVYDFEELGDDVLHELEEVSTLWREGVPERGFTMAMDSLRGDRHAGSVVVLARDGGGAVRGFLHFVPSFGRPAMSLSFMRRDRATPNGLTEFLVVRAIELLRARGIDELSLNFAAFGRWLGRPEGRLERVLGRVVAVGNRFFQIESLYRFNDKFEPRWEPRYLVFERPLGLPRVALAALRIEGQLPTFRR